MYRRCSRYAIGLLTGAVLIAGCEYEYEDDDCSCPPTRVVEPGTYATAGTSDTGSFVHGGRPRTVLFDRAARRATITWTDTAGRLVVEHWRF